NNLEHGNPSSLNNAQVQRRASNGSRATQCFAELALRTVAENTSGCVCTLFMAYFLRRGGCATQAWGFVGVRRHRRAKQLRLSRQHLLCLSPPDCTALFDAVEVRHGELSAGGWRPGRIVDGFARPADLHIQAAAKCVVS